MDMQMIYAMIWILFIAAVVFLGIFFGKRLGKMKQEKQQAKLEYENKKEKYSYLKPGVLDDCPREDVAAAVLFHCMRKEDEDFDHAGSGQDQCRRKQKGLPGLFFLVHALPLLTVHCTPLS